MNIEQVLENCLTGDLILFKDYTKWYDGIKSLFINLNITHIGFIIKGIIINGKYINHGLLELIINNDNDKIYTIKISPLLDILNDYIILNNRKGKLYYRPLTCSRNTLFYNKIKYLVNNLIGEGLYLIPSEWILSFFKLYKNYDKEKYYSNDFLSSAMIIYLYDQLDFIDYNKILNINNISLDYFSYYNEISNNIHFKYINLEPELIITK